MIKCPKRFRVVCLVLLLTYGLSADLCPAQSSSTTKFESASLPWSRLSFKADSLFGKVTTEVRLAALPAKEAGHLLLAVPQADALQPSGEAVISITVDSNIDPLIGPKEILNTRSLCNPYGAAALQLVRLRQGGKIWQKSYRFQPDGVYHQRKKPVDKKQLELPPEQWNTFEKRFYQYNGKDHQCPAVLETSELIYLASVIDFTEQKAPLSLCVFDKQQVYRVTVIAGGARQLKVDYLERSGDNQTRRNDVIDALKISFQPRALVLENEELEIFSFLGFQGEFDIFVDPDSRLPVQVSDKIGTLGRIDIKLKSVEFAQNVR